MDGTNNPQHLYESGLEAFRSNKMKEGIQLFLKSASLQYTPAIKELGICFLNGIVVEQNITKAIKYFKNSKNEAESQFELSKILYFGYGVKKDHSLSSKLLIKSALKGFTPAINLMALGFNFQGNKDEASTLFSHSFRNKDRFATHLVQTNIINLVETNLEIVKSFNWEKTSIQHNIREANTSPQIFSISGMLDDIECEYLKYIASPYMRESMTIDPETGGYVKDSLRTSYSASIDWMVEDPATYLIMEKCCQQFGISNQNSEPLHILHYSIGEEYKPHYDYLGGVSTNKQFNQNKQRIKSICIYLNDVEEGGETSFPRLNINFQPKKGTAIFFENANKDSLEPYVDSLHAGMPVKKGEKWLATLWIQNNTTNRGPDYETN